MSSLPNLAAGAADRAERAVVDVASSKPRRGRRPAWAIAVLVLAAAYFIVPLVATAGFALSTGRAFSVQPLIDALTDSDFVASMALSVVVALVTTIVSVVVVAPTSYLVVLRFRRLRTAIDFVTILPFVIPPIILTLGLRELYGVRSPFGLNLVGSPLLLVWGYVVLGLPFVFRAVDNAMRAVDVRTLTEASESLGANGITTFVRVIVPNVRLGILSGALLSFTTIMGEFTLASLLGYTTFPVFLNGIYANAPRPASSLVIVSFLITWACVLGLAAVGRRTGTARATAAPIG